MATQSAHTSPPIYDPNELHYTPICIFHKPALFIDCRIDKLKLPKEIHCYEAMHDDTQSGIITMISIKIHVNFWGSILTTNHIKLENGYRDIDEKKDMQLLNEISIKLHEFLRNKNIKKSTSER